MTLLEKSNKIIMVVNPGRPIPMTFWTSEMTLKTTEMIIMTTPRTVTSCIGAVEKDEMLLSA